MNIHHSNNDDNTGVAGGGRFKRYEFDKKRAPIWSNDKNLNHNPHKPKVID